MTFRLLVALALAPMAGACDLAGACTNDMVRVAPSPDGAHDAILFERDCGATTSFTTQISIVPHGAVASGSGNVLIADGGGETADAPWHGPWADMRWLAADGLLVVYDADARLFKQAARVAGVTVGFRARPPPEARR